MKLIKEIISKKGELHFRRYAIFQSKYFSIYIHKIYKADEDEHLHNHPWNIFTIILKGGYVEHVNRYPGKPWVKLRTRFDTAYRERYKYHKVYKIISKPITTLALVFGKKKDWGYLVDGKHIDQIAYRIQKTIRTSI